MVTKSIKKTISFCVKILIFTMSITSFSQTEFGIVSGVNMSRFNNEFSPTNGSYFNTNSMGFKLGVFAEIPVNDNIYFSPKLIYNQLGDREKDYGNIERRGLDISTIDYKLNYLSIPLNLRFFNKVYLEVGPQIGILLTENNESLDLGKVENTIDLGANLEIGYKINDFRVSINIYHGFTNTFEIKENLPLISNDLNARNFALSINIGYVVF